jgi:hypothetical protein
MSAPGHQRRIRGIRAMSASTPTPEIAALPRTVETGQEPTSGHGGPLRSASNPLRLAIDDAALVDFEDTLDLDRKVEGQGCDADRKPSVTTGFAEYFDEKLGSPVQD